jgi:hypothetical protein
MHIYCVVYCCTHYCICVQDLVDPVADEQLAKFVVESHRRSHPNQPHFGEPNQVMKHYREHDTTVYIPSHMVGLLMYFDLYCSTLNQWVTHSTSSNASTVMLIMLLATHSAHLIVA